MVKTRPVNIPSDLIDFCQKFMVNEDDFPTNNLTEVFCLGVYMFMQQFYDKKASSLAIKNFNAEIAATKKVMAKQNLMTDNHYGWKEAWKHLVVR